ncbi:MAG: prepilin-type N-terminal cleavage/methylation domain-containing protein [Pseudomonadota bacterium]
MTRILCAANTHIPTPSSDNAVRRQRGVTLMELLIVLAIMALATGLAAPVMRSSAETRAFDNGVKLLVSDLRRVRDAAERQGTVSDVELTEAGYRTQDGDLDREWPRGFKVIATPNSDFVRLGGTPWSVGSTIAVTDGTRHRIITIEPFIGRIESDD